MRITSLFSLNAIALDVAASNQEEILDKVVELQSTHNNILLMTIAESQTIAEAIVYYDFYLVFLLQVSRATQRNLQFELVLVVQFVWILALAKNDGADWSLLAEAERLIIKVIKLYVTILARCCKQHCTSSHH